MANKLESKWRSDNEFSWLTKIHTNLWESSLLNRCPHLPSQLLDSEVHLSVTMNVPPELSLTLKYQQTPSAADYYCQNIH